MLETMIVIGAAVGGFVLARNFVLERLRFVDAAQSPLFALVAGVGAALVTWPLAALPLITATSSAFFGLGTGLGTRSGAKALRSENRTMLKR